MRNKFAKSLAGISVAVAMCFSSSMAAAATVPTPSISPFVALAAYGTMQSRAAVCGAAVGAAGVSAAASAAAAAGQVPPAQGCVLPQLDVPPPVVVETAPGIVPAPLVANGFGFGIGALLAGLVLAAGLAAVLLSKNNGNNRLPISPD